jgi:hypothetical protein
MFEWEGSWHRTHYKQFLLEGTAFTRTDSAVADGSDGVSRAKPMAHARSVWKFLARAGVGLVTC